MTANHVARAFEREISQWYGPYRRDFLRAARKISRILSQDAKTFRKKTQQELDLVSDVARTFVTEHKVVAGSGVILFDSLVPSPHSALQWWLRDTDSRIVPGESDLDVDGTVLNDYEVQPWFTKALESGRPTLIGPYIDHRGMKEYIVTLTIPVRSGSEPAGVFGTDIRVKDLEGLMMPALRALPGDAALINTQGRVIVGNSARLIVGDRISFVPKGMERTELDLASLGLELIYSET